MCLVQSELESVSEKASQIRVVVSSFPRTLLVVMRYLFAFLNQYVSCAPPLHLLSPLLPFTLSPCSP